MIKRALNIIMALLICHISFSQETGKVEKKPVNEIKLNMVPTLRELFPEINFERMNKNDLGLGLAVGISLHDYERFQEKFRIMPYVRSYFGSKPKFSCFFEANITLSGLKKIDSYVSDNDVFFRNRNTVDSGFGFAYGGKFFINNGFIVEFFLGCGFFFSEKIYPRIGLSIGKQF